MEFTELINSRESIRNYDPSRQVPEEVIRRILDAGRIAPSACNMQPWKFLLISSPEMLEKVRDCYDRSWFRDAPHVVVVVGIKDQAWVRSYDMYRSVETDAAIAMTHIILAGENEGVATCWIAHFDPAKLRKVLGITPGQEIIGMTPLGYPRPGFRKSGNRKRKDYSEVVEIL